MRTLSSSLHSLEKVPIKSTSNTDLRKDPKTSIHFWNNRLISMYVVMRRIWRGKSIPSWAKSWQKIGVFQSQRLKTSLKRCVLQINTRYISSYFYLPMFIHQPRLTPIHFPIFAFPHFSVLKIYKYVLRHKQEDVWS